MKYLRYLTLAGLLMLPLAYSQAQISVGIGFGPGYVAGPPVCAYGYYPDYPYACAPYGYYGPSWFVRGVFIGAGPWYHGWGHPYYGGGYYGRPIPARPFEGRGPVVGRGFEGRGPVASVHGGGGFHGEGSSHGGGGGRGRR